MLSYRNRQRLTHRETHTETEIDRQTDMKKNRQRSFTIHVKPNEVMDQFPLKRLTLKQQIPDLCTDIELNPQPNFVHSLVAVSGSANTCIAT